MGLRETLEAATPGPWEVRIAAEVRLRNILKNGWFVAGNMEQQDARLIALAPELAALVLDMGEALRRVSECPNESAPYHSGCTFCAAMEEMGVPVLLSRLDQLGKEQTDG